MRNTNEHTSDILRKNREQLISNFLNGDVPDFLEQNARLLDDYFRESFEKSMVGLRMVINKTPYAIIALGGYGRGEQCIHSDVDILFLFEKNVPDVAEELIQEVVYPLWDIGLDVGHATRSLEECVELAGLDIEVMTSLLDSRFICGMSFLYSKLTEKLRKKIVLRRADKFIRWLIEKNRERHEYFGDSAYLLEPNLKEGQGGLRDYHTLLWIARIRTNVRQPRDMEYYGCLSHDEFNSLTESLSFIWEVRNRLHFMAGRKYDQLHFEYQEKLASAMNFRKVNGQQSVEVFLGRLHAQMEFIKQRHLLFLYELENTKTQKRKKKLTQQTKTEGLEVKKGTLQFAFPEEIFNTPDLMIKIFEESARLKLPLGPEARRLMKDFIHLIDDDFRNSPSAVKSFERILATPAPTFNVLNEMLNTGFLIQFIPEFSHIESRIQYDEYHLYPVDKHSLRTVRIIKKFGTSEDPLNDRLCADLYEEITDKILLLWGALLHDIGKGEPGGNHSQKGEEIVCNILTKKGYSPEAVETVSFLVREHLLLIKTATRRDINDEETAIFCARKIKDTQRLKMLYLLTVADSVSTGPKAWNDWTSTLLRDLFLKVLSILEKGELATTEAVEIIEKKKADILRSASASQEREDMETLFNVMSPRYLLNTLSQDILDHIRLYEKLGNADFVWEVVSNPDLNTRTLTICAKDRPGLVSKIAGVFTLNSINILDVRIFTWRNNIALDVFEVNPPPDQVFEEEKWQHAKENLQAALSGQLELAAKLSEKMSDYGISKPRTQERPLKIVVDNDSSSFFTIVEVFTYDFPGLLFRITDALFRCKLDVWVAKIATKIDQVVDVFYIRDFDGQKADSPDQIAAIKAAIEEILPNE
ncbi:[protein-PII] uridylyltransferase [Desulfonema magnum]|uniref:Bifunctional uridylyltransferase/uridylyl-removing enzyme n=1 Tax=Desulfonema magnum TaxID=45655 RepID=A0A975BWX3_9BACT|nr:[protein-PII] uridylyltransferase [Desulfonema magnum]QTA93032.1 Bifunctional uridylyltransferase/uridylyl-removing enzyme [Desulfonema magnum]